MSISISGQNDPWAQLNAYQASPKPLSSQNGPWNTTTSGTAAGGAAPGGSSARTSAGGTAGALTDGTAKALLAFGGWASGLTISSQTYGQTSGGADPASSTSPSADPAGTANSAITPTGTATASALIADLQSMLASLTTTPASGANGAATTATPDTSPTSDAPAGSGTIAATSLGTSLLADLQTLGSDLAALSTRAGHVGGIAGQPPTSPGSNDIANSGSVSASASADVASSTATPGYTMSSIINTGSISNTGTATGTTNGYSDSLRQQFALSAYLANQASGLDNAASTSMTAMNV